MIYGVKVNVLYIENIAQFGFPQAMRNVRVGQEK